MGNIALEINDINLYYGGIHALKGISLKVYEGEIITLIETNLLALTPFIFSP